MEAETINCPMCGAATSTDKPQCQYCEAQLATVACPSCFAMMFLGSKHCPRCGAEYARANEVASAGRKCPRCQIEMHLVAIGDSKVLECAKCLGLWLNTHSFETLCADKEQQSAVLGNAALAGVDRSIQQTKVNYVPCPECSQLMNRANFARCSGVIIDLCKQHGVWFDRNELSRIVEFIRSGGLEMSRAKEKNALEEERRQLHQEQLALDMHHSRISDLGEPDRVSGIASASGLLKFLLG
jgi:Zn-finger nucleic acid-binding protein